MRSSSFILPRLYRNFSIAFFVVTFGLLIFVGYLIWAEVTINLTSSRQTSTQQFSFEVGQDVEGEIHEVDVSGSKQFAATGSETIEATSGIVGEITVVNNYSKDQALIKTTRIALKSDPETVIARLDKNITVPAGSEIKVQVYTEDIQNFKDVASGKFIIPGLWEPLWEKIYAVSDEALTLSDKTVPVVAQDDLDQSEEEVKKDLYQQAIGEINDQLSPEKSLWPKLVSSQVGQVVFDAEAGEQASEFTVNMEVKASVIVFDESQVVTLAKNILGGGNGRFVTVDPETFSYSVDSIDVQGGATVTVSFEGSALSEANSDLLDKNNLLGKTESEIQSYFSQFSEVESTEVIFTPSWLKKTPRIKSKINIEVL